MRFDPGTLACAIAAALCLGATDAAAAQSIGIGACTAAPPFDPGAVVSIQTVVAAVTCQSAGVGRRTGLVEQARAALESAQGRTQPAVSIAAGPEAANGTGVYQTVSARLSWVLFDFGMSDATIRQARDALAATLDEQNADVLAAIADAAQLFSATQVAQGRYETAVLNLRTTQDSLGAAQTRQGAGAASVIEQLQAQTAVSQARLEMARAYNESLSAKGALALAMGLRTAELKGSISTEDTDDGVALRDIDLNTLLDEARERHPRVLAARARLTEVQARAASIRAERWGSIGVNAGAGRGRTTSDAQVQTSANASLTWTIPLFDRADRSSRLHNVLGDAQVREARLDEALRQTELQVWQEGRSLIGERRALRESRKVLENSEQTLKAATERYRLGVGGFRDILNSQTDVSNARYQWVDVRARVLRSQWRLAAAMGRLGPMDAR